MYMEHWNEIMSRSLLKIELAVVSNTTRSKTVLLVKRNKELYESLTNNKIFKSSSLSPEIDRELSLKYTGYIGFSLDIGCMKSSSIRWWYIMNYNILNIGNSVFNINWIKYFFYQKCLNFYFLLQVLSHWFKVSEHAMISFKIKWVVYNNLVAHVN